MMRRNIRLPMTAYRGRVAGAFTICVADRLRVFIDAARIARCVAFLRRACTETHVAGLLHCFMPDHVHLIICGRSETANVHTAVCRFKQYTGYMAKRDVPTWSWQRSFFDRMVRSDADLAEVMRYVSENPVRAGLVADPADYPFTGSIGRSIDNDWGL
jgi:putative transposase